MPLASGFPQASGPVHEGEPNRSLAGCKMLLTACQRYHCPVWGQKACSYFISYAVEMPAECCCLLEMPLSIHEAASLPPCAGLAADQSSPVLTESCLLVVPHRQDSLPRNTPLQFYPICPSSSLENRSAISSHLFSCFPQLSSSMVHGLSHAFLEMVLFAQSFLWWYFLCLFSL